MDTPDIDSGGPLRLPGDERNIGVACIETAVDKPAQAFMGQRQYSEKPFALGRAYIEMILPRDSTEVFRVMFCHRLNDSIGVYNRKSLAHRDLKRGDHSSFT